MSSSPRWSAVIVAAGKGSRFGQPKQLIEIAGEPMLSWSVRTFAAMQEVAQIVVVTEAEWLDQVTQVAERFAGSKPVRVVRGGPTRQSSTFEGLQLVSTQCDAVFVHDGARPLVMPEDVRAGMKPVRPGHAALLAVRVVDTIKTVSPDSDVVVQTHERSALWAAQTPQFATLADMRAAHQAGLREGLDATDDAMLLERAGVQVHVVPGSPENFKVTLAEDRDRAEFVLRARLALHMQAP